MRSLKKKSKCRLTDRPIELFLIGPEDIPAAWRTVKGWMFTDVSKEERLRIYAEDKVYPKPQDFCWKETYDGDPCTSKIRPENMRAQLWACGRHMSKFQEEEERKKRNARQRQINEQKEQLFAWELEKAITTYEKLQELGWGAVLPDPPRKSWGTQIRNTEITISQEEFLALVAPPQEEEEEYDDDDFESVEEDFFASDL